VTEIVRERRPDIVHTTLFEADVAGRIGARRAGVPVVSTLANESYGSAHRSEYPNRRLKLLGAQVVDLTSARLTVRMHAVSNHVADVMATRLLYPRSRIDVIPRGRDAVTLGRRSDERREQARRALGLTPGEPLVLTVARQERAKGLDVLIDTVKPVRKEHEGTKYAVAGRGGGASGYLLEQLAEVGAESDFTFLGTRSDVAELLCAADVFVLPSRREGLPGSLLEAMALECPVVVSDLPQVREVVDESTALIVPPDDPDALAEAITQSLSDPAAARARTDAARVRFCDRYTVGPVAERMIEFYERALAA
jgi:glycosyltransferase involved in cell wall biosynthesis